MEIDNKCLGRNKYIWYDTGGCTFVAMPTEDGRVRISLECRSTECVHSVVTIKVGFDEYSSFGLRKMWSDELKETAFGRRNCENLELLLNSDHTKSHAERLIEIAVLKKLVCELQDKIKQLEQEKIKLIS